MSNNEPQKHKYNIGKLSIPPINKVIVSFPRQKLSIPNKRTVPESTPRIEQTKRVKYGQPQKTQITKHRRIYKINKEYVNDEITNGYDFQPPKHTNIIDKPPDPSCNIRSGTPSIAIAYDTHPLFCGALRRYLVNNGYRSELVAVHCETRLNNYYYTPDIITDGRGIQSLWNKFDIIYVDWCLKLAHLLATYKPRGKKLIIKLHRIEAVNFRADRLKRLNWPAVDGLIVPSDKTFNLVKDGIGINPIIIPNYIDDEYFPLQNKTNTKNFGILGNIDNNKGQHILCDAVKILNDKGYKFDVYIKGLRYAKPRWVKYVNELVHKIPDNVHISWWENDCPTWFKNVGCVLSLSAGESFHCAVGEGLSTGCNAIINNWDGANKIWGPYVKTINRDPHILANMMEEWLNLTEEQRINSGLHGREFITKNYGLKTIGSKILNYILTCKERYGFIYHRRKINQNRVIRVFK